MEENLQSHTVSSFDQELKKISGNLESMGSLLNDSIAIFNNALNNPSDENIKRAKEVDSKINELNNQVEKLSTNLIALRHPLAIDLRYVISAIQISTIIERQGDMVKSAVKKIIELGDSETIKTYRDDLTAVSELNCEMITHSVKGFSNQDVKNANKVWRMEDKVDEMTDEFFDKLKKDVIESPENIDDYVSIMLIARAFERIGDYCTKITKATHYVESGKRVSEKDF
jgi:phosphate transport system protein